MRAHLRGIVIRILSSHGALFFCLGCSSLREPLWVLEQVNFGANFKIFDEIVEKVFVVLGLAVLSLKDTPPWSLAHTMTKSKKAKKNNSLAAVQAPPFLRPGS